MEKLHSPETDELFRAILSLETVEECYRFFEDVSTIKELQDLSQRFAVARMLTEGRVYSDVQRETGASTATISRVNKALNDGSDGYKLALARLYGAKDEQK